MTYIFEVYNGEEKIGEVRTNHSITAEEAYELLGMEVLGEEFDNKTKWRMRRAMT